MTKDALKQLIREMVQEEVKHSLPTILPQIMAEIFTAKSSIKTEPVSATPKRTVSQPAVEQKPKKELKIYTKNEILNKVLNETVGGIPQEGSLVASSMAPSTASVMDHIDKVPESVSKALTKDYSALLKAMDKRKPGTSSNIVGMV